MRETHHTDRQTHRHTHTPAPDGRRPGKRSPGDSWLRWGSLNLCTYQQKSTLYHLPSSSFIPCAVTEGEPLEQQRHGA
jgi:hypothetical protein